MIIVSPTVFIEGDYMNFSGISGTGPYAFDHRESGQYTRFVRNEDYWGDAPYYDEIIVKYIPESTSRIQALQNGEIDMIFGSALLSYDEYVQVTAMDGMAGQISESDTRVRDLVVNASRPLLTDLKVRQAIAYPEGRVRQLCPSRDCRMKTKKDECSYSFSNAIRTLVMSCVTNLDTC